MLFMKFLHILCIIMGSVLQRSTQQPNETAINNCPICSDKLIGERECTLNFDANKFKIFENSCLNDQYNCLHPEDQYWFLCLMYEGSSLCTTCPPKGYAEKDTYTNEKNLESGPQTSTQQPNKTAINDCPICSDKLIGEKECTLNFDANKFKIFENSCLRDQYNCLHPEDQYLFLCLMYEGSSRCTTCPPKGYEETNPSTSRKK